MRAVFVQVLAEQYADGPRIHRLPRRPGMGREGHRGAPGGGGPGRTALPSGQADQRCPGSATSTPTEAPEALRDAVVGRSAPTPRDRGARGRRPDPRRPVIGEGFLTPRPGGTGPAAQWCGLDHGGLLSGRLVPAGLRWLRVAQREHYLAGSVLRFAGRWWGSTPLNLGPGRGGRGRGRRLGGVARRRAWRRPRSWPSARSGCRSAAGRSPWPGPAGCARWPWCRRSSRWSVVVIGAGHRAAAAAGGGRRPGRAGPGGPGLRGDGPARARLSQPFVRRGRPGSARVAPDRGGRHRLLRQDLDQGPHRPPRAAGRVGGGHPGQLQQPGRPGPGRQRAPGRRDRGVRGRDGHLRAGRDRRALPLVPARHRRDHRHRAGPSRALRLRGRGSWRPSPRSSRRPPTSCCRRRPPAGRAGRPRQRPTASGCCGARPSIRLPTCACVAEPDGDPGCRSGARAGAGRRRWPVPHGVQPTNLACAVGVALALGVDPATIAARLGDLPPVDHRLQSVPAAVGRRPSSTTPTTPTRPGRPRPWPLGGRSPTGAGQPAGAPGWWWSRRGWSSSARDRARRTGASPRPAPWWRPTSWSWVAPTGGPCWPGRPRVDGADWPCDRSPAATEAVDWVRRHLGPGDAVLYENDLPDHYP